MYLCSLYQNLLSKYGGGPFNVFLDNRADWGKVSIMRSKKDRCSLVKRVNNINDVALVFEGGGMRASYTSALAIVLLENGINITNVYGNSAGSSNTVNYVSGDIRRTRESFVEFADDPNFGGIDTFLQHKGIFNAQYIYQESGRPGNRLEFNFDSFAANPARATIAGFERDTGKTVYWTRDEMTTLDDLMVRVRASSSLPIAMPAPVIDGVAYYDGGLGEGSGIMVPRAEADGFEKLLMVCTRPRGYRKQEKNSALLNALLWRRPHVREALATRAQRYNEQLDYLDQLEREGRAYVFYSEGQEVESGERSVQKLIENHERGYAQAQRELEPIATFLGL